MVWSGVERTEEAADLDYSPSVVAIYEDLSRQVGHAMQPPTVAFLRIEQITEPLTEAKQEEDRETSMYIEMFSKADLAQSKVSETQVAPAHTGQPASAGQTT